MHQTPTRVPHPSILFDSFPTAIAALGSGAQVAALMWYQGWGRDSVHSPLPLTIHQMGRANFSLALSVALNIAKRQDGL